MPFQQTVNQLAGFGVPGEFRTDSPRRVQSYILDSDSPNVFGYAFSIVAGSPGTAQVGNPGGTSVFAGFLVNPKQNISFGTTGSPLSPTLTLPNNQQADIADMGDIIVQLPAAANIGDLVVYDDTTGALSTVAPNGALPTGKSPAYAIVDRFSLSGAGLAVITVTRTFNPAVTA